MIQIAEFLAPYPNRLWALPGQMGIQHAVGALPMTRRLGSAPRRYLGNEITELLS